MSKRDHKSKPAPRAVEAPTPEAIEAPIEAQATPEAPAIEAPTPEAQATPDATEAQATPDATEAQATGDAPMADPAAQPTGSIDRTVATVATTVGRGRRITAYNLAPYVGRGSVGGVHYQRKTAAPLQAKGGSWVATLAILCSVTGGCPLAILDAVPCGDSVRGILAWLAAGMGWGVGTLPDGGIYLHDGRGLDGQGQGLTVGRPIAHPGTLAPSQVRAWGERAKVEPAVLDAYLARMTGEASQVA